MIIRAAELADARSGAACHLACWREAYATLAEPERLASLTADLAGKLEMWQRVISQGSPPLVAVEGEEVVGFIGVGPSAESGVSPRFQLQVLNVRRSYWGTGLAQRLHDEGVGERDAFLWVMRDNARARAFYARNGFQPDGATKIDPEFDVPIIRMVRTATPRHPTGPARSPAARQAPRTPG
jgi:GNAT superfamily N-acetyltransferase